MWGMGRTARCWRRGCGSYWIPMLPKDALAEDLDTRRLPGFLVQLDRLAGDQPFPGASRERKPYASVGNEAPQGTVCGTVRAAPHAGADVR